MHGKECIFYVINSILNGLGSTYIYLYLKNKVLRKIKIVCKALWSVIFIMFFQVHFTMTLSKSNIWLLL